MLVGPFTGRQTARAKELPLLRVGFPNHDRVGAGRQLVLGYEGAGRLVDTMAERGIVGPPEPGTGVRQVLDAALLRPGTQECNHRHQACSA